MMTRAKTDVDGVRDDDDDDGGDDGDGDGANIDVDGDVSMTMNKLQHCMLYLPIWQHRFWAMVQQAM